MRRFFCWLIFAGFLALPALAQGDTGGVSELPNGVKPKNKVRMTVDSRWVDANGYRPIRVTLEQHPKGPAPADRQFRVTISADDYGAQSGITVTDIIELPQGQPSVTKSIALPQSNQHWRMHVNVREDGVELRDLEADLAFSNRYGYGGWSESSPSLLFLDSDAPSQDQREAMVQQSNRTGVTTTPGEVLTLPDVRNLALVFPDINYVNRGGGPQDPVTAASPRSDLLTLRSLHDANRMEMLAPAFMPTRWIEWTCFDVIFVTLDDLQKMAATQFEALAAWLRAGGTLCVHGTGVKFARVAELEKLLSLPPQSTSPPELPDEKSDWRMPKAADLTAGLKSQNEIAYANPNVYSPVPTVRSRTVAPTPAKPDEPQVKDAPFLVRNVMFGKVVVFHDEDPFPGTVPRWQGLFNMIGADHWMWYRRHGMSLTRENASYWEFLIPGVGKAPVLSFLAIITIFMLIIGPINYSWLKRRGRLQLLLLTVPAGAAFMVGGLFIFALVTDGLSVRSRIRSYTQLDQKAQKSVSWSRQTYYAALAPSRGLLYPETAAVYSLEAEPVTRTGRRQGGRVVEWDDAQRLRSGYVFPRTAAQFLVINAEPSQAKLEVQTSNGEVSVKNQLGAPITLLILRDEAGEAHLGSELPVGQTQLLKPIPSKDGFEQWSRLVRRDEPDLPADWSVSNDNLFTWMGMPRGYYWQIDQQAAAASQGSSLLERGLADGDPGKFLERLPLRSYIACTTEPVGTPLGLERTHAKASLHVTFGRW